MPRTALAASLISLCSFVGHARADSLTVTDFHGNPGRTGNYVVPALTWTEAATIHPLVGWSGKVQGPVHAQPLYYHSSGAANGQIIISTDAGVVEALDSVTGKPVWSRTLGTPVPSQRQTCGNPGKWPDVGTPVIDDAAAAVYVTESTLNQMGSIAHLVWGISLVDGSVLPGWPVDIQQSLQALGVTFDGSAHAQRGALALVGGTLYVPYGGGDGGDCLAYNGWIMAIDTGTPQITAYWQTRASWGGLWAQGGVTYDGTSLFVATGNTRNTNTWQDGEAVLRLQSGLLHSNDPHDYFAPQNWLQLDHGDDDLGGTGPLPIDVPIAGSGTANWLLALGKDGNAYVLDRTNLGGIGGALLVQQVSTDPIRTAAATWAAPDGVFVTVKASGSACPPPPASFALATLKITAQPSPAVSTIWCGALAGTGTPVVTTTDGSSNPIVWMVGSEGDQQLHAFRGDTGQALLTTGPAVPKSRRYVAPLVAEGKIYVASDGKIRAFAFGP